MAIPALAALMIAGAFAPAVAGDTSAIVIIDIKPGSDPNSINPSNNGVIPVAILGMDGWIASTVDPTSLKFMAVGGGPTLPTSNAIGFGFEDVNGDEFLDLVAHFPTQTTRINCGTNEGVLYGTYLAEFGGGPFMALDSINPVGKDCRITR